jgi:lysylphosphatidylglycerol synthetase-like protein (DUF2156 family)
MAFAAALATVVGTIFGITSAKSSAKRQKSQAEQAERVRQSEATKAAELAAAANNLSSQAESNAASIMAGRKKRTTIATSARGILSEPITSQPQLFGE